MRGFLRLLLMSCAWLPGLAAAHSASTAYLEVEPTGQGAALQWRIALRDLDALLDLDADRDGRLTWGEVIDRADAIDALALDRLTMRAGDAGCVLEFAPPRYERLDDLGFARLAGRARCDGAGSVIAYRLFEGLDPSHRALLHVAGDDSLRVVAPGAVVGLYAQARPPAPQSLAAFVREGFEHILGGLDHVLFLIGLMLPAVLRREHGRWVARDDLGAALASVAWIASAFTLAHSATLAAATFGVVRLPAAVIEPLIAATVLATALNNLRPMVTRRLAWMAFGFGLIHGFGFAELLAPLALPRPALARALFGFNAGVELGQLAVVGASFAALAALRRWSGYSRWVLAGGSGALAFVAAGWIVERLAGVAIFAG